MVAYTGQCGRVCAWVLLGALFCCTRHVHAAPAPAPPGQQAPAGEPAGQLPAPRARDASFRRGVTIGPLIAADNPEEFMRAQTRRLSRAQALGATDVKLLVRWTQTQRDAVELAPFDSVDDELLGWLIKAARARKLRVWLVPSVAVETPDGPHPASALTPTSWDRWWWSYRRFVLHYAQVARMRKVPLFAVGDGLTSAEPDAARWRSLIRDVRKAYPGELTYIASSASYARVPFWHDLDLVGVALAPTVASEISLAELPTRIEAVEPAREFLITETDPGVDEPDARHVLRARHAIYENFADAPKLGGVYVNDAEPHEATSAPRSKRKKRPAPLAPEAEVIRYWFRESTRK